MSKSSVSEKQKAAFVKLGDCGHADHISKFTAIIIAGLQTGIRKHEEQASRAFIMEDFEGMAKAISKAIDLFDTAKALVVVRDGMIASARKFPGRPVYLDKGPSAPPRSPFDPGVPGGDETFVIIEEMRRPPRPGGTTAAEVVEGRTQGRTRRPPRPLPPDLQKVVDEMPPEVRASFDRLSQLFGL